MSIVTESENQTAKGGKDFGYWNEGVGGVWGRRDLDLKGRGERTVDEFDHRNPHLFEIWGTQNRVSATRPKN